MGKPILLVLLTAFCGYSQNWEMHTIDASSSGADGVKLADINNDGLLDITTGWEEGGITKIYLHPGKEKVKELWPSVIVGETPSVEDAVFMDVDNDGQLDIVSCTEGKSKKIFVHFAPKDQLLNSKKWRTEVLPASVDLMQWMYAEPFDVDGKNGLDILAGGKNKDAAFGWFEAPENRSILKDWKWHPISSMSWLMSIIFRDMDADGDMDIIVTDRKSGLQGCRWLENSSKAGLQKKEWQSHYIGAENLEVMFMAMSDMDGDGTEEVILAEKTHKTIRIYRKSGIEWKEQIIQVPDFTGNCKSVEVGDINGDGIKDLIFSTETGGEVKIGLTWVDGKDLNQENPKFQAISKLHRSKYDRVELIDIDLDGDLDVLICEENFGENSEGLGIVWYENRIIK
jgi:hypothetical protein